MIQANTLTKLELNTPTMQEQEKMHQAAEDASSGMIQSRQSMFNATAAQATAAWDGMLHASWKKRALYACFSWAIYVMLALLIWAMCYPGPPLPVADSSQVESAQATLESGHFSCFKNPEICLCACCCPGLRWADTISLMNLTRITVGLSLVFLCALLNGLTGFGNAIVGPVTVFLMLYYRHELRAKFDLPSWTCGSCCIDFIYILCCPWCAIAQEARAVTHHFQKGAQLDS